MGLFLLLAVAGDRLLGGAAMMLARRNVSAGRIGEENVLLRQVPDILLLGSSHAKHHYDDSLLSARTGCVVRNAGADGTGVLYARALLSLLPDSSRLKLVVWEVSWFRAEETDIHTIDYLYGRGRLVDSLLAGNDWRSSFKLRSVLYRYNGLVGPLVRSLVSNDPAPWGFKPLEGSLAFVPNPPARPASNLEVSPWLAGQLKGLITDVRRRGAEVIFTQGPSLEQSFPPGIDSTFRAVARREGVPWISLTGADEPRFRDPTLFRDAAHLNRAGATLISDMLVTRLAEIAPLYCR